MEESGSISELPVFSGGTHHQNASSLRARTVSVSFTIYLYYLEQAWRTVSAIEWMYQYGNSTEGGSVNYGTMS